MAVYETFLERSVRRHSAPLAFAGKRAFYVAHGKRVFDLTFVVVSLPICILMVGILVAARRLSGRRCFVFVDRIGRSGARFTMVKMADTSGKPTRSRLDRLPMIWNVWSGNMSLIGPKAMTCRAACAHRGASYFHLRPGLIDPADMLNRATPNTSDKARLHAEYVMKQGLFYDLFILYLYCFRG